MEEVKTLVGALENAVKDYGGKNIKVISTPDNPNLSARIEWATKLKRSGFYKTNQSCQDAVKYLEKNMNLYIVYYELNGKPVLWFYGKGVNFSIYVDFAYQKESSQKQKGARVGKKSTTIDFPATATLGGVTYELKAIIPRELAIEWAKKESGERDFVSYSLSNMAAGLFVGDVGLYKSREEEEYILVFKAVGGNYKAVDIEKEEVEELLNKMKEPGMAKRVQRQRR